MQGAKLHGSAERKSVEEAGLQVLLDRSCCVLVEAVDDACLPMFASEDRSVDCCLLAGRKLSQLAECLMSACDVCGTWNACSVVLDSQLHWAQWICS